MSIVSVYLKIWVAKRSLLLCVVKGMCAMHGSSRGIRTAVSGLSTMNYSTVKLQIFICNGMHVTRVVSAGVTWV